MMLVLCIHEERGRALLARLGGIAGELLARVLWQYPGLPRTSRLIEEEVALSWRQKSQGWQFCRCAGDSAGEAEERYRAAFFAAIAASGVEVRA